MSKRSLEARLADIKTRILRIQESEALLNDAEQNCDTVLAEVAFDAILYGLLVIGEAVRALPQEFLESHSEIPWSEIVSARNILAHEYFRVDARIIRATLDAPLMDLFRVCGGTGFRQKI